ncbi:signal peptidase II [Moraxella canis]|uniref:Lipoprotein signal peptidase n=1 Tax=Moraxella canis TaxID=90239 RepID=A0A1S9ZPH4_9GAMM|nr:signal peptidase II [Moraxella canis]OOR85384.1 signal peptidase II [Moraxella canis]
MPNPQPILVSNGSKAMGYYLIAIVVLVIDQLTKYYFKTALNLGESIAVIPPVLNWTLAYNYGAAFSFLADQAGWQKWFFAILGLVVSGYIIVYLRKVPRIASTLSLGLALVLGGAIGNVIDRILRGHVIDFIHVHYADVWHYPIFNIADMGICIGMAMVVYDMLFLENKRQVS